MAECAVDILSGWLHCRCQLDDVAEDTENDYVLCMLLPRPEAWLADLECEGIYDLGM